MSKEQLYSEYKNLWYIWAAHHPTLLRELANHASGFDNTLKDSFANTEINQARALCEILTESSAQWDIQDW